MKKLLFTFVLLLLPMIASADAIEINGIYYILSASAPYTAEVTYKPSGYYSGSITIPASVTEGGKTYNVTSIGARAFQNCSDLNSIDIPNTVTNIGEYAFYNLFWSDFLHYS